MVSALAVFLTLSTPCAEQSQILWGTSSPPYEGIECFLSREAYYRRIEGMDAEPYTGPGLYFTDGSLLTEDMADPGTRPVMYQWWSSRKATK